MTRKRKIYDLWMRYDNFLRSLHLETLEEQSVYSRKKRFFNYLKRLPIILFASLLTTLTFQFFINPNKLFNSGLNGIVQVVTNYFFMKNGVGEQNRAVWYYAIVVLVNVLIVSTVQLFHPYNFEVNSTAIFYVLFQFIWSSIFRRYSLQNHFFSRFSAQSWSNLSPLNQLGLTLPFYITIAVVSAIIHTYGYSLIYRAKSTPGGFEIVTSTLLANDKEKKVSIGSLNKLFSIFVIFFVTIFNFLFINDNVQLKTNRLIDLINSKLPLLDSEVEKIRNKDDLSCFLDKFNKRDLDSSADEYRIRKVLEEWSGDRYFEKLQRGILTYLDKDEQICEELDLRFKDQEKSVYQKPPRKEDHGDRNSNPVPSHAIELSSSSTLVGEDEPTDLLPYMEMKVKEKRKNTYEKTILGYFKYITNDEKLWASLIYIFFSSYLINQIFPKSKVVLLTVFLKSDEDLSKMTNILQKYNPSYSQILSRSGEQEQKSYLLLCPITKWDYQLLASEVNKSGKVLISTLDESH